MPIVQVHFSLDLFVSCTNRAGGASISFSIPKLVCAHTWCTFAWQWVNLSRHGGRNFGKVSKASRISAGSTLRVKGENTATRSRCSVRLYHLKLTFCEGHRVECINCVENTSSFMMVYIDVINFIRY